MTELNLNPKVINRYVAEKIIASKAFKGGNMAFKPSKLTVAIAAIGAIAATAITIVRKGKGA